MRTPVIALLLATTVTVSAQPRMNRSTGSGPVSPSVLATTILVYPSPGQAELQLLVLWRGGTPGWFMTGGISGDASGSRGSGRLGEDFPITAQMSYGGKDFILTFSAVARKVTIQNEDVSLGPDDNVVLLDDVDTTLRIVGTLHIDPHAEIQDLTRGVSPQHFIRRSPELVSYLRCDTTLSDPTREQIARILCAALQEAP